MSPTYFGLVGLSWNAKRSSCGCVDWAVEDFVSPVNEMASRISQLLKD